MQARNPLCNIPVVEGLVEGVRIGEGALRMGRARGYTRLCSEAQGEGGEARGVAGAEVARTSRLTTFDTSQPLMSSLKLAQAGLQAWQ